jgi:nitroreductase
VSEYPNSVIETLLNHKSVRRYSDEKPSDETIETIVRAGQQAPFVSQMYSVLLTKEGNLPFDAPLLFTICVDIHKLEVVMNQQGWDLATNDLSLLLFGMEDASLMAENMVIAGESLGLGSCFLGMAPYYADRIIEDYDLPEKVFPMVQLAMGYPEAEKPTRPRYPLDFTLFEDEYPDFDDEQVKKAMKDMNEGYMDQDYYEENDAKIPLQGDEKDEYTYENYGWTEHISRKWGQWHENPEDILDQLRNCGFHFCSDEGSEDES